MVDKVVNVARSTLASTINATDDPVTFSVAAGEGGRFDLDGAETLVLTICKADGTGLEVLRQTARSGDTLTATRAIEAPAGGTATPVTHGPGDLVVATVSAGALTALINALPISIPGADPTGMIDSAAAVESFVQSVPAGSYVKLRPGDRYAMSRGTTWALNDGVTIEAYGAKFFQLPTHWNGAMVSLTGTNVELKGVECYGWATKTISGPGLAVISGSASAGSFTAAAAGGAPDVTGIIRNPDWFARDVNGNFTESWPLTSTNGASPSVGTTDVVLVASQCAFDVAPPLVAPIVTDSGLSSGINGPEASADYWYAWTKVMSDRRETGIGPMEYYHSPSAVHFAQATNMPTHEGTPQAGVAGFALYRAKSDPSILTNWKLVLTCSADTTVTYDTIKTGDLEDIQPRGTTILAGGTIPQTPAVKTCVLTHQIEDEEQQLYTWCQRVTPSNGNTISLSGSVVSVGRVGYGSTTGCVSSAATYTGHSGIKLNQNAVDAVLKDCKVEGFDYVGINNTSGSFAIGATMDGCLARANMEQNSAMGCSGFQWLTRNSVFGESGSSSNDNEPETTGATTADVTVYNTIFRNWGSSSYGWHSSSAKNRRTHFSGVIFKTFGTQEAINGGAQTFTGDCQIVDTRYVARALGGGTALTFQAENADLDVVVDGLSQVSISALTNGNLASGLNISGNGITLVSQVIGTPNVFTIPTSATQPVGFAVGDHGNIPSNTLKSVDNPYAMPITAASWAANVATITTTPHTTTLTAGIAAHSAGDTVTVSVTTNANLFPDWNRTPKFWFYIGTEAFKCISKSGAGNKDWSCVAGEFSTAPAIHAIGDTVIMPTSQLIGDQQVVRNVKSTNNTAGTADLGYNRAAAITAIGLSGANGTVKYALASNPGTFNASTGPTTLGAQAWNNTAFTITAVSGTTPGATLTAEPYVLPGVTGNAETALPSPAFQGGTASLSNIIAQDPSTNVQLRVRYVNVVNPEDYLTLTCPNSRVQILTNDGRDLTFISDSDGVAYQSGYVGVVAPTGGPLAPVAGPFPFAKGAWGTDAAGKFWTCTTAGSPGTWKSVATS